MPPTEWIHFSLSSFVFVDALWQARCNAFCSVSSVSLSVTCHFSPFVAETVKRDSAVRISSNSRQASNKWKENPLLCWLWKYIGRNVIICFHWCCVEGIPHASSALKKQTKQRFDGNGSTATTTMDASNGWIIRSHQRLLLSMLFTRHSVLLVSHFIRTRCNEKQPGDHLTDCQFV